jgi:hypothetical protein
MEAVDSLKTLVSLYQTTRRHIPDGSYIHIHRRQKLESHGLANVKPGDKNESPSLNFLYKFARKN